MTVELFNIDCMEYMATQPDNAFDLAVVDPPYGIKADSQSFGKWQSSRRERRLWDIPPNPEYFTELQRVSRNSVIWGGNYFGLPRSRCWLVWDKGAGFKGRDFAEAELAWTNIEGNVRIYQRDPLARGDYAGRIHEAQKPSPLYQWILGLFAKPGQRILDTHLGSGSSAIAAHYFGVDFVGCEIDEHYFNLAKQRFDQETRQTAMF